MHISKIEIQNYRNIYKSTINLDGGLNVIIGPNNSGKSNILSIINYLYVDPNKSRSIHDLNKNYLVKNFSNHAEVPPLSVIRFFIEHEIDFDIPDSAFVKLDKFMTFNESGDLDATEDKRFKINAVLEMRYELNETYLETYRQAVSVAATCDFRNYFNALKKCEDYFSWNFYNNSGIPVDHKDIKNIFEIEMIEANRNIDNIEARSQSYAAQKMKDKKDVSIQLREKIDVDIKNAFCDITDIINTEIAEDQESIGIIDGNNKFIASFEFDSEFSAFFKYELEDSKSEYGYGLPVKNNGLGFNNLIHIRNLIKQKKDNDYNILLIEEPESHLHPNMQYKLLKYIAGLTKRNSAENVKIENQIIITTHSSNITASTPIDNMIIINYIREGDLSDIICVQGRSIFDINRIQIESELSISETTTEDEYIRNVKFLKKVQKRLLKSRNHIQKFLDVTRSDMLFASKIILVEGVVEKLLLPVMASKIGKEGALINNHVSVIEVGGINFNHFIPLFFGLRRKALCITDCDYKYFENGIMKDLSLFEKHLKQKKSEFIAREYENSYIKCVTQKNYGKTFEVELFVENFDNPGAVRYLFEVVKAPACILKLVKLTTKIIYWENNLDKISRADTRKKIKRILDSYVPSYKAETNSEKMKIIEKLFFAHIFYEYAESRKGDLALKLAVDDFKMLKVPEYIKEGLEWLF